MPSLRRLAAAPVTALILTACTPLETMAPDTRSAESPALAQGAAQPAAASGMRVFTRNIFLGGDTGPLFSLDFADIGAVLAGVNDFWGQVQATDFGARVQTIADDIANTDPHVVALQEVARYTEVDLSSGVPTVVDGTDFLATLQAALLQRGLSYELAVSNPFVEGQLPLAGNLLPAPPYFQPTRILDLAVGEATLVRSDVKVLDTDQGAYQVGLDLGPLSLDRGWSRVRVKYEGMPYHVVNTHLETQGIRPVHDAQADELIESVLGGLNGMTILVGDLNSDALGAQDESNPAWTPTYAKLIGAGFADAWLRATDAQGDGATCCFDPDLLDPDASNLVERIDYVLVRRPGNPRSHRAAEVGVSTMNVLGDDPADRVGPDGLWPADHAGLFAEMFFPDVSDRD